MIDLSEPHYDWLYSGLGDIWGDNPGRLVAHLTENAPPGTALDVGCGAGKNALHMAKAGWQVDAFDASDVATRLARSKLAATDVKLNCADLRSMHYTRGRYDSIVLYGVAHCLSDGELEKFGHDARTALKPDGQLHLASFTPNIPVQDGHFRRPVYARSTGQLLHALGSPRVDYLEMGHIEEEHGRFVPRHRHSMCWMTVRYV